MSSQHHNAPYETTDADAKQVSVWTISIFVTILAGLISMAALLFGFVKFPVSLDRTPTAAEYERNLPPTPRLQTTPKEDLLDFRAAERAALSSYGWVDRNKSIVRIPVADAMKLTLERGLPSRAQTAGAAPNAGDKQ